MAELAKTHPQAVVLAVHPQTCFTCEPLLAPWMAASQANRETEFLIALTKKPAEKELAVLRAFRLPMEVVVLRGADVHPGIGTVRAFRYCGGAVADSLEVRGLISSDSIAGWISAPGAC